ncbi:Protein S-acyltransferase 24 [Picochlorum sp. SENEW3]|nr:Protein S-acyltransferase 24 [Picochlorum sp. SENEW3]
MGDTANDSSKVVEITTLEEKKPQSRKGSSQGDVEEIDTVWKACAYGDFDKLKQLVEEQAGLRSGKQAPVANAVKKVDAVKEILDRPDDQGYYCLQWAALNNRVSIVAYLIDQGVNINAQDRTKQTALHWSVVRGSLGALDTLLRAGSDAKIVDSKGYSLCHVAAQYGQTSILYYLYMKWGIDIDSPDADGRTPLHWAAYKGFRDTCKLLIVMDADVMKMDIEECTPLHWAAMKGHLDACMVLLQGGAEDALETTDASGCTPSQLAIDKGHRGLGLNLAEYRYHKESRRGSSRGLCATLSRLHLAPVIWGIILSMLGLLSVSIVWNSDIFPASATLITIGAWITYSLAFVGLIFLYKTTVADPGFLPRNTVGSKHEIRGTLSGSKANNRRMEEGGKSDESSMNSPALWAGQWSQLCVTCRIVRPLRAKHCATTDRCVQCFDHFCPWVGNAIGKGNRHYFLVFLWLELAAILASGITVVSCLQRAIKISNDSTSPSIILPIIFVVFDMVLLISVAALAIAQASQVSRNVTTNELSNWHRYTYLHADDGDFTNPFDQGCRSNCSEVCYPDRAPKFYTLDSRAKKPSNALAENESLMKYI